MWKSVVAALWLVGSGCGAMLDGNDDHDELDPALSPIGRSVVTALREKHPDSNGFGWHESSDDSFTPGWILQTPPVEFWGQPTSALPVATDCSGDTACDPDFHLIRCTTQADCRFGG